MKLLAAGCLTALLLLSGCSDSDRDGVPLGPGAQERPLNPGECFRYPFVFGTLFLVTPMPDGAWTYSAKAWRAGEWSEKSYYFEVYQTYFNSSVHKTTYEWYYRTSCP